MEPMWREAVRRLAKHPDFQVLWQEGPIHDEIERLRTALKDPTVRDPVEIATVKNQLYGIEWVYDAVQRLAENPSPEPEQKLSLRRMRRTIATFRSQYLPRPLG